MNPTGTNPSQILRIVADQIDAERDEIAGIIHSRNTAVNLSKLWEEQYGNLATQHTAILRQWSEPRDGVRSVPISSTIRWKDKPLRDFAERAGIEYTPMVYQQDIELAGEDGTRDNNLGIDEERLVATLEKMPEEPGDAHYPAAFLDWEGKRRDALFAGDSAADDDFIRALEIAHDVRPAYAWAHYDLIPAKRSMSDEKWAWACDNAAAVIEAKHDDGEYLNQVITLAMYRFYPSSKFSNARGVGGWWSHNIAHDLACIHKAKEVADGRRVVAMVMDQYHGGGESTGDPMEDIEFESMIRLLIDAGADEICWWQQDHAVSVERGKNTIRSLVRAATGVQLWEK